MKRVTIILVCFLATACIPKVEMMQPKAVYINDIELNSLKSAEIGDKLIEKGMEYQKEAVVLDSVPEAKYSGRTISLKKGDILPYAATVNSNKIYIVDDKIMNGEGVAINTKTGKVNYYTNEGILHIIGNKKRITYTMTGYSDKCDNCFKQQFIFNGRVGNSLKFIYREFKNDMIRPAFDQELQYDLSESNIIGFKGLRMEIVKATNTNIQYKVLSNFN